MCGYSFSTGWQNLSSEEFEAFFRKVEGDFIPPLLERCSVSACYNKWSQQAEVLVARIDKQIVALCCFYANGLTEKKAYVPFIAVAQEYRGRGIASVMLRRVTHIAAEKGMLSISLHTSSESARKLYERHGFVTGEEQCARFYMEKNLKTSMMNILLTSAGRRTYLVNYFKKALTGKGLVHASNSVMTYTLSQADKYVITPAIYDTSYIDFLLKYCVKENISAIVSLFDIDLPVLARHSERFAEIGVRLVVSSVQATSICNDKWETYCFLKGIGCVQPQTFLYLDAAESALRDGGVSFPLFIKPRWGMGSIGIYQAETMDELRVFYQKVKKEIFKTYLRFESMEDQNACVLIQEKITGSEYGLDVLNDLSGNYVTTIAKKKLAMRAGETDSAEIVDAAPFESVGRLLSRSLSHVGNLDVDCFVSDRGEIYVLELNCRFGGQYPFSHIAGADFPRQIVTWLEGGESNPQFYTPQVGTVSVKELTPTVMYSPS